MLTVHGGVHGTGFVIFVIFVVSNGMVSSVVHFAFNSFWLHFGDFWVNPFAPHGKITSIYKKKSSFFFENEKS